MCLLAHLEPHGHSNFGLFVNSPGPTERFNVIVFVNSPSSNECSNVGAFVNSPHHVASLSPAYITFS